MPNSYFTPHTVLKYTGIVNCVLVIGVFVLTVLLLTFLFFILFSFGEGPWHGYFVTDVKVSFFLGLIPGFVLMMSTFYTSCVLRDLFG